MNQSALQTIRRLVGPISERQLRFVESAADDTVGVFIPATGQCGYAITPRHTHPAYSVVISLERDGPVAPKGIAVEDDELGCTLMSPDVPHEEVPSVAFARYVAVLLESSTFERIWQTYSRAPCGPFCWTPFVAPRSLLIHVKAFMAEYQANHPGRREVLSAVATYLAHSLVRAVLRVRVSVSGISTHPGIQRSVEVMHAHYGQTLSVPRLARAAGCSESHFSRLFKREMGTGPAAFLVRIRIGKARTLLSQTEENVSAIALQCGFASCAHFSTTFRRIMGVSPLQYRRSFR